MIWSVSYYMRSMRIVSSHTFVSSTRLKNKAHISAVELTKTEFFFIWIWEMENIREAHQFKTISNDNPKKKIPFNLLALKAPTTIKWISKFHKFQRLNRNRRILHRNCVLYRFHALDIFWVLLIPNESKCIANNVIRWRYSELHLNIRVSIEYILDLI